MIDYTKESKLSVKSAVEKLTKDLMDNKWGVLSVIDVKKISICSRREKCR